MPTRYLKPGIRDSATIERIAIPHAEILYYRLIVTVDDYGRTDARPAIIKGLCFPLRSHATQARIKQWLSTLHNVGLIFQYVVDGRQYLQITRWDNKPRSESSKYPPPSADVYKMHTDVCALHTVLPLTVTVTGTETVTVTDSGERKNGAPHTTQGVESSTVITLPLRDGSEFDVKQSLVAEVEPLYPAVDVPQTLREMKGWLVGHPDRRKTRKGVRAFITTWLRNEQEKHGG